MRKTSYKKIVGHTRATATSIEDWYHDLLIDYMVKDSRTVATRRNVNDEIDGISRTFNDDGIVRRRGVNFISGLLPGQTDVLEKKLGLSDAKADYIFGIHENRFPMPKSFASDAVKAVMGVAPGIAHPFFVIENKGAEGSLERAQN